MDRIDRPQNRRSRRTRVAVLDAAWELLEEGGPALATVAAIAGRAGVSRQALYLHFASRAELLFALHEHVDRRLDLAASIEPVLAASDGVTALEAFAAHLARYHPQIRAIDLALLRAQDDDPDVAALVEEGTRIWRDVCAGISRRLAEEGRLAEPWTVQTAADLLWTFMFPETLDRLTRDRGWPNERYRELLTVLLRRALVTT